MSAETTTQAEYERAVGLLVTTGRGFTTFIQRRLGIAYGRAVVLMERAEAEGVVAAPNQVGKREVLLRTNPISE